MTTTETTPPSSAIAARAEQYCTFRLGNLLFGVEVHCVQEVLLTQQITRMPLASPVVSGLINLRGQIVTAIDLRRRLLMPPLENGRDPKNIVVRSGDAAFALIVDEIGDVLDVDPETFEAPPSTLTATARELILGVYRLETNLLLVLDTELAISLDGAAAIRP